MDDAALEKALLLAVSQGDVESDAFASANGADHKKVVGLLKSLESSELVRSAARDHSALKLAAEAEAYLAQGTGLRGRPARRRRSPRRLQEARQDDIRHRLQAGDAAEVARDGEGRGPDGGAQGGRGG